MDEENVENSESTEEVAESVTEEVIEAAEEENRIFSEETSYRSVDLSRAEFIDKEKRTVRTALSSESPVERSFGMEVLDHSSESIDMTWARSGNMPVLLNHDTTQQVGIVEDFNLDTAFFAPALMYL